MVGMEAMGSGCAMGLDCSEGTCEGEACGAAGQACCGEGMERPEGGECGGGGRCVEDLCVAPCGGLGQACCADDDGEPTCDGDAECIDDKCANEETEECGGRGEACCAGPMDEQCRGEAECMAGTCEEGTGEGGTGGEGGPGEECGGPGQGCCAGPMDEQCRGEAECVDGECTDA